MLLKPYSLKKKIESDLQLSQVSLKKDWHGFYKYVLEQADICETFSPLSQSGYRSGKGVSKEGISNAAPKQESGSTSNAGKATKPKEAATVTTSKSPPRCLNPDCNQFHLMRDCTVTPVDLKKKLVTELRKSKGTVNAVHTTSKTLRTDWLVNHDENIHVHPTVGCARQNGKRLTRLI